MSNRSFEPKNNAIARVEKWKVYTPLIEDIIAKHVTPESMFGMLSTMMSKNPTLANCTDQSLIGALVTCSKLGLDPTPELGLVAFIPRKNKNTKQIECNFQIMYKGLIKLAKRSGQVKDIIANVVYKDEIESGNFYIEHHTQPGFYHRPILTERFEQNIAGAYSAVLLNAGDGSEDVWHVEWMPIEEILKIRDKASESSNSEYSPWVNYFSEMCRKSPLKRVTKQIDCETEIQKQLNTDDRFISIADYDKASKELIFDKRQQDYNTGNTRQVTKDEVSETLQAKVENINSKEAPPPEEFFEVDPDPKPKAKKEESLKPKTSTTTKKSKPKEEKKESEPQQKSDQDKENNEIAQLRQNLQNLFVECIKNGKSREMRALLNESKIANVLMIDDIATAKKLIEEAKKILEDK